MDGGLHALVILLLSLVSLSLAANADEWRSRSIYQLLTDRFAVVGDAGAICDTAKGMRCGGSWQGIINHVDYIQQLGFDAVWISPIVANLEGVTKYGQAYHGYWTRDIHSLNLHFGSQDDLKKLSSTLHSRGMYLMVDVVVNHMALVPNQPGAEIQSNDDFNYTSLTFPQSSDYHPFCWVKDYTNQTEVEQCWLGDSNVALVDVNTEDPNIVAQMNDWIKNLVQEYGIDGIRIDTVKHVRADFWPAFVDAAGVFSMGEVFVGDVNYVDRYTQVMDSVLDYPGYYALVAAFASVGGNLTGLVDIATQSQKTYRQGAFMTGSFLENQDNPRFQNMTGDSALVKNAIAYSFVTDGIPILYYGQEQGFNGGNDPSNREALWLSGYQTADKPLVAHVQDLNKARKVAISKNDNFLTTPMTFIPQTDASTIAVWKAPMLTLLTNTGASGSATWSISGTFGANEDIVDVLSCTALKLDGSGSLVVASDGGMPRVLMPKSAGLCSQTPSVSQVNRAARSDVTWSMKTAAVAFIATVLVGCL